MKNIYCITCPIGCKLTIIESNRDTDIKIVGNECQRGYDFAKSELTSPTRTLTTTVRTTFPDIPVLPVRTNGEIPKVKIFDAMRVLAGIVISSELDCGDVVVENIVDSGVNVIATSDILN